MVFLPTAVFCAFLMFSVAAFFCFALAVDWCSWFVRPFPKARLPAITAG